MQPLRVIFASFFKIGLFTFGGGYAMIPIIERELIDKRKWIDRGEFLDLLTLAQSVPGPIAVNTSVFVGYRMRGLRGAVAALTGAVLPSFALILVIALFFAGIRQNPVVDAAFKGMRPAVVALIVGPVVSLARGMHPALYVVIAAAALAIWGLGWSPILVLAAAALSGVAWELTIARRKGKRYTAGISRRETPIYRPDNRHMILLQLFVSYLKIGFFGFGGGYAMLSLIQNEVVVRHAWMTNAEFADIVAVSQITPGPIAINSATYVGYTVGAQLGHPAYGILGSAIATFAVCLPSLTLMILVARFFLRLKGNRLVEGAMSGMRPVVIGMIAAAALLLIFPRTEAPGDRNFIDAWSWVLFGSVLAGSWRKVNPILLILLSAAAGIVVYYIF